MFPFASNIYLSFTDYSVGAKWPDWIGLDNYAEIFTRDALFVQSVSNTVIYVVFSVPLGLTAAFVIAMLLNTRIRGRGVYRTVFYVPSVVPIVATAVVFSTIFNARYGAFNQLLAVFGLAPIRWLSRPEWVKPSLIIMSMWSFGAQMVIFLAGLQGIPEEQYEAAEVDGGNAWHKLRFITVPHMTPTIFFNLITGFISSFQVFTSAFVMLSRGTGPLNSGLFFVTYLYRNAFTHFRMGYAAALSVILFLIILALTLVMVRVSGRWVHYGDE